MIPTFILTAELDPASFAWLDGLRRAHFPPERNLLPAHLTLFHRLSSAQAERLYDLPPPRRMPIRLNAPLMLGFGVAILVQCSELERFRATAKQAMDGEFSRQDAQGWRPHVTIQNKVAAHEAKQLYQELAAEFQPRVGEVTGLLIWEYLNGPWKSAGRLAFR